MENLLENDTTLELCPAALILLDQINKRWPDRDKDSDALYLNNEPDEILQDHDPSENGKVYALDIDTRIGPQGKMREGIVSDQLALQIIDYVKNAVPGSERIKSVAYKGKIASGEFKDRFWVWRKGNYGCTNHIHISFKQLGYEDPRQFQLPIFKTKDEDPVLFLPKEKVDIPRYPGKEKLSFGQKNESVRRLQRQLMAKNYSLPLGDTSEYDDQTKAAVRLVYHKMRKSSSGKDVTPTAWNFLFGE